MAKSQSQIHKKSNGNTHKKTMETKQFNTENKTKGKPTNSNRQPIN